MNDSSDHRPAIEFRNVSYRLETGDDLLRNARNTVRFSIGPAFNFGPNIAR